MRKLHKKILFILEITISFVLAIFFSIKIINPLYVSVPYPQVENNAIYLKGIMNKRGIRFSNLIGFDYRKFLAHFPAWHNHDFSEIINSHSLIITSYSLTDFTSLLLKMRFPYWHKGGVKISFKIGGKWYTLGDLVELKDKD